MTKNVFNATNALKVLSFLCRNPENEFINSEIQKTISLSRMGIYFALQDLIRQGLVKKQKKGKQIMYSAITDNPLVKQFKIVNNIILLEKIVNKLRNVSRKIVLFGSSSRGEDYSDSDIDLFIWAKDSEVAKSILSTTKYVRKIQAIIKTSAVFPDFQKTEQVFHDEIERGITLWEEHE